MMIIIVVVVHHHEIYTYNRQTVAPTTSTARTGALSRARDVAALRFLQGRPPPPLARHSRFLILRSACQNVLASRWHRHHRSNLFYLAPLVFSLSVWEWTNERTNSSGKSRALVLVFLLVCKRGATQAKREKGTPLFSFLVSEWVSEWMHLNNNYGGGLNSLLLLLIICTGLQEVRTATTTSATTTIIGALYFEQLQRKFAQLANEQTEKNASRPVECNSIYLPSYWVTQSLQVELSWVGLGFIQFRERANSSMFVLVMMMRRRRRRRSKLNFAKFLSALNGRSTYK